MSGDAVSEQRTLREPEETDRTTLPGLRVEYRRQTVSIDEYGSSVPGSTMVARDEIPELIEALIDGAREGDLEEIEARVQDAVHWGETEEDADAEA